jgi:hypothetical protein
MGCDDDASSSEDCRANWADCLDRLRAGRPEYNALSGNNPHETPLESAVQVAAIRRIFVWFSTWTFCA